MPEQPPSLMGPDKVQCRVQVGQSKSEFWVAADLLDAPPDRSNDARQDSVIRQCTRSFVLAYTLEATRRRGDLGAKADNNAQDSTG